MSKRYRVPTVKQLDLSERLFDTLSTLQELAPEAGDHAGHGRTAFSRLYAYATEPDQDVDPELERAMADDPGLRRDFRRLLEKIATNHLPRVAAASTGPLEQRVGEGCRIRFEPSRAQPTQVFIVIELTDRDAPAPTVLFTCDSEGRCQKFPLPPARDGVIQILQEKDSELLQGLLDIGKEVFLR